ncbi:hypothetical protein VP01_930g9 [Puccinia sorghi]|uniref:TRAPPC10/Trs130 N-terminal domain-containing protein n=1 Tax=Puccinia sorghi TaxID=27349 RepID=A0A0L6U704_9BASI|nr:hypothetical protein VP01_930g9 [Puccinia sorghi]
MDLPAIDPPASIIVSYHTSPSPDVWERIQTDLHRQLPLRNLHWKPKNRPLRAIPSLPICFQAFDSKKSSSSPPAPSVYLLFVACDDHEAYKTIIKQEIRTWLDCAQVNQSEWLIVHVSTAPKLNPSTAGIFRTKTGVLDKLKADFNPQKTESELMKNCYYISVCSIVWRCIQLSYMSTMDSIVHASMHDSSSQWTELLTRLKQSLLVAFDSKINETEDSLRTMISTRSRNDWNFQEFFIQKAQLANQFEMMNLFEDGLIQSAAVRKCTLSSLTLRHQLLIPALDCPQLWRDKIYGKKSSQYSRLALKADPSEKYLDVVASGQMSILDLRIYMFSKQANLLRRLNRLDEAIKRASIFISSFAAFLRSHEHMWPANYIESWVYCACNELVEWCEERINPGAQDTAALESLRCCAQLLELAHSQLDRIGIQAGHLPATHPFNMSLSRPHETPSETVNLNTSPPVMLPTSLTDCLKDPTKFEKVYLDLARRTINLYQSTGRRRSALKLHCKTAAFEQIQSRQESAHRLYSHLPAHYVDEKWTTIESSLLDRCASLQKELGLSREWLLSTLALVRSGVTYEPGKWSQEVMLRPSTLSGPEKADLTDQSALANKLMQDIKEQSLKLEKDFAAIGFPIFSIALNSSIGRSSETIEGSLIEAKITNLLPCVNSIFITLDPSMHELNFSFYCEIRNVVVHFRRFSTITWANYNHFILCSHLIMYKHFFSSNILWFINKTPVAETLILDVSQIRISRILFQYYHRPQSSQNQKALDYLEIISFPKNLLGLDVKLDLPSNKIKIVNDSEDKVILEGVQPGWTACLLVPFYTSAGESCVEVNINVDYRLSEDPSVKRALRKACTFKISLPIHVKMNSLPPISIPIAHPRLDSIRDDWVRQGIYKVYSRDRSQQSVKDCWGSTRARRRATRSGIFAFDLICLRNKSIDCKAFFVHQSISFYAVFRYIIASCWFELCYRVILPSQTSAYIFKVATTTSSANFSDITVSPALELTIKYRPIIDGMWNNLTFAGMKCFCSCKTTCMITNVCCSAVEIAACLRSKLMLGLEDDQRKATDFLVEQVIDVLNKEESYDGQFYSTYLYDHVLHSEILLKKVDWSLTCERVEKDQAKKMFSYNMFYTHLVFFRIRFPARIPLPSIANLTCHGKVSLSRSNYPNQSSVFFFFGDDAPPKRLLEKILTMIDYQRSDKGEESDHVGQVGIPIPMDLLISTSFKWLNLSMMAGRRSQTRDISCRGWFLFLNLFQLSNPSSFLFTAPNKIERVKLILVPLRPGYLSVPQVSITTATATDHRWMESARMTASVAITRPIQEVNPRKDSGEDITIQSSYLNSLQPILVVPSAASSKFLVPSINSFPALPNQSA